MAAAPTGREVTVAAIAGAAARERGAEGAGLGAGAGSTEGTVGNEGSKNSISIGSGGRTAGA